MMVCLYKLAQCQIDRTSMVLFVTSYKFLRVVPLKLEFYQKMTR